ncbi:MAG: type IV secretory system conjugative DNA transfer family protein [Blastocatellia bacterium]
MKQTTTIDKNKERHILLSDQRLLVKHLLLFCCVFICLEFLSISLTFAQSPTPQLKTIATPPLSKEQSQGQVQSLPNNQAKTDKKSNGSSDNKKDVAKSGKAKSPSLSPTPSQATTTSSLTSSTPIKPSKSAQKANKNGLEDEGEKQAAMIRNGVDFAKNNFPLILVLGSAIIIVGYNRDKLLPKKVSTSHGSAHFATRSEVKHLLRPMGQTIESGELRVGKYNEAIYPTNKYLHLGDKLTLRHNIVLAPTGVGKSCSIFLPNCYHNQDSFICTDPKSELWQKTSGVQSNPHRFAPTDPDNSTPFNFIPICKSIKVAKRITGAIVYAEGVENGDKFWANGERQLLTALLHYTAYTDVPTPTHAYELLCSGHEILIPLLANSEIDSVRRLATSFVKLTEKALTGIIQGLTGKLNWLEEPAVRRFTSSVNYTFDFSELKRNPTQVYFCLNEDDVSELPQLIAIFFNMAMVTLKTSEGDVPVKFLLDEFGNIGRLLNFDKDITLIRSKNISVTAGLQAIAQIEKLYGKNEAAIILGNFTNKIILNSLEPDTAKWVSRMVGDFTHTEKKITKINNGGILGGGTTTESESSHARPLLNPDEITRLSSDQLLLVSGNLAPVMLETIYYDEPPSVAKCGLCPDEIPIPTYPSPES